MSAFLTATGTALGAADVASEAASGNTTKAVAEGVMLAGSFIPGPVGWGFAIAGLASALLPEMTDEKLDALSKIPMIGGVFQDVKGGEFGSDAVSGLTGGSMGLLGLPAADPLALGSLPSSGIPESVLGMSGIESNSGSSGGDMLGALAFGGMAAGKLGGMGSGRGKSVKGSGSIKGGKGRSIGSAGLGGLAGSGSGSPPPPIIKQEIGGQAAKALAMQKQNKGAVTPGIVPPARNSGFSTGTMRHAPSSPYDAGTPFHSDSYGGRMSNARKHAR